jgi:hypothetical protein
MIIWFHYKQMSRVDIHKANFADVILDLQNFYSQSRLCFWFSQKYRFVKSILFLFLRNLVISSLFYCLGKCGKLGRFMDYEYKKIGNLIDEIYSLVKSIYYILDFTKYFCLWIPTQYSFYHVCNMPSMLWKILWA